MASDVKRKNASRPATRRAVPGDATRHRPPTIGEFGLENFAPYLINRTAMLWNARMLQAVRGFGLTTTKMRALAVLSIYPSLTVNELAQHAATEQSTMSRTLDALERQGFVSRQIHEQDGRVRSIAITAAGAAFFQQFWPTMLAMHADLMDGVDETEFAAFAATLHKLLANLAR